MAKKYEIKKKIVNGVEKVCAPDAEHINDPEVVKARVEKAAKRRPKGLE